jgi:hypothetical protein
MQLPASFKRPIVFRFIKPIGKFIALQPVIKKKDSEVQVAWANNKKISPDTRDNFILSIFAMGLLNGHLDSP